MVDRTSRLKLVVDAVSAVASVERLNSALNSLGATASRTKSQLGSLLSPLKSVSSAVGMLSSVLKSAGGAALGLAGFLGGGFLSALKSVGNFIKNTLVEGLRTFIRWSVRALAVFATELVHVQVQMDKFKSIMTLSTKSSKEVVGVFNELAGAANVFGLALGDQLFKEFGKFRTVMVQAGVDGRKFQEMFANFAQTSNVFHLDTQDAQFAILALTQMVSKGKVSMEELRRQLAERIPGAMQVAARAFQTTTSALEQAITKGWVNPVMMVEGILHQLAFETQGASKVAINSMEARLNRLNNSWFAMKRTILESGVGKALENFFDTLNVFINRAIDSGLVDKVGGMFANMAQSLIGFFQDTENLNAWWTHFSKNWGDILLGALMDAFNTLADYISKIEIVPKITLIPDQKAELSFLDTIAAQSKGAIDPLTGQPARYGSKNRAVYGFGITPPQDTSAQREYEKSKALFGNINSMGFGDLGITAENVLKVSKAIDTKEVAKQVVNMQIEQMQQTKMALIKNLAKAKAQMRASPTGSPENQPMIDKGLGLIADLENQISRLQPFGGELKTYGGTLEALGVGGPPDKGASDELQKQTDKVKAAAEAYRLALDPMYAYQQELKNIWEAKDTGGLEPQYATMAVNEAYEKMTEATRKADEALQAQAEAYTMLYDPMAAYTAELENIAAVQERLTPEVTAKAVEDAYNKFKTATEGYSAANDILKTFDQSFNTMLNGVLQGTQTISQGFEDMAKVIIAQILKIMAYQAVINAFGGSGGGTFGQFFAEGVGMAGSAKGTAFEGGNVIPFAKGGVVNRPTTFPMGLMGEAGPEAIMPLTRGKGGKLGVSAAPVNLTVNNMASGVRVNTSQSEDGGITLDIVMEQVSAAIRKGGNSISNAMEDSYSLGRGRAVY